jgi:hypothetical protein
MPVVYHQMSECLLFTTKWVNACCLPPNKWMPVVYHQMSECPLFTTKWVNACCLPPNEWMPGIHSFGGKQQAFTHSSTPYDNQEQTVWYIFGEWVSGCCLRTESVVYFWGVSEWLLLRTDSVVYFGEWVSGCCLRTDSVVYFCGVSEWLLFSAKCPFFPVKSW